MIIVLNPTPGTRIQDVLAEAWRHSHYHKEEVRKVQFEFNGCLVTVAVEEIKVIKSVA